MIFNLHINSKSIKPWMSDRELQEKCGLTSDEASLVRRGEGRPDRYDESTIEEIRTILQKLQDSEEIKEIDFKILFGLK